VLSDESPRDEIIIRRIAHADDLTIKRDQFAMLGEGT
jgi:hypothetical protein